MTLPVENIAEEYLKNLQESTNPGGFLAKFYKELFEVELTNSFYIMFNRLVKLYGRERVYYAILSCTSIREFKADDPVGILTYFCTKGLVDSSIKREHIIDTSKMEKDLEKLKKRRKTKFEDPFEERN